MTPHRYHVRGASGKQLGPFAVPALTTLLQQNKLTGEEDISEDGISWFKLRGLPELAAFFATAAYPASHLAPDFADDLPELPAPKGGGVEVVDLPGLPEQHVGALDWIDLPAPKGNAASAGPPLQLGGAMPPPAQPTSFNGLADFDLMPLDGPADIMEVSDLPAPKDAGVDLPAPKQNLVDLPGYRGGDAQALRPAPIPNVTSSIGMALASGDLQEMGLNDINADDALSFDLEDLPIAAPALNVQLPRIGNEGIAELPAPKMAARSVSGPVGAAQKMPTSDDSRSSLDPMNFHEESMTFAPPTEDEVNSLMSHVKPGASVDFDSESKKSKGKTKEKLKDDKQKKKKKKTALDEFWEEHKSTVTGKLDDARGWVDAHRWVKPTAIAIVALPLLGVASAVFTDFGFLGVDLITGKTAQRKSARALVVDAQRALATDSYDHYQKAVAAVQSAVKAWPEGDEIRLSYVQVMAAAQLRFGHRGDEKSIAQLRTVLDASAPRADEDAAKLSNGLLLQVEGKYNDAIAALEPLSQVDGVDPALVHVYRGWAALRQKQYAAAKKAFDAAVKLSGQSPAALWGLAKTAQGIGDAAAQKNAIDQLTKAHAGHIGATLMSAQQMAVDDVKKAAALFDKVVKSKGKAAPREIAEARAGLADLAQRAGNNNEAREHYLAALKVDPLSYEATVGLGQLLLTGQYIAEARAFFQRAQLLEPQEVTPQLLIARSDLMSGKPDDARALLQKVAATFPQNAEARLLLGLIDAGAGKVDEARGRYQDAIKLDPHYVEPYIQLSRSYLAQGKKEEAFAALASGLKVMPKELTLWNAQGEAHRGLKEYAEAQKAFEQALTLAPDNNAALFGLAKTYKDRGELVTAKEKFEALHKKDEQFPGLAAELGDLYFGLKDYDEAVKAYEIALKVDNPAESVQINAGRAFITTGAYDRALKLGTTLLENNPALSDARALRAEARFGQGNHAEALSELQQAIDRERKGEYFVLRGRILQAERRISEATDAYGEAIALDPSRVEWRLLRAQVLVRAGTVQDGLREIDGIIKTNPELAIAHLFRGIALTDLRREPQAVAAFEAALARDPKLGEAHLRLGRLRADGGKAAEAAAHFQSATTLSTAGDLWRHEAYFQLGMTAQKLGKKSQAVDAFKKYLEYAPRGEAARSEAERALAAMGQSD